MLISLPNNVEFILSELNNAGFKAYVVGGCIRDSLLRKKPKDWDITTDACPEEVMEVFKDFKIIPTGIKHGTVTLMIEDIPYEITTFRAEDTYDENRRPENVTFIKDVREDLARRDFTINAMAYHPQEGLIDPFGGRNDLVLKLIRVVRNDVDESWSARFMEDPLRAFRAYRFVAKYGFDIEKYTLKAGIEKLTAVEYGKVSKERIRVELEQILLNNPLVLDRMPLAMIHSIFPYFHLYLDVDQNNPYHIYNVYAHTFKTVLEVDNKIELKLAALFHDIGKIHSRSTDVNGVDHFYGHANKSAQIAEKMLKDLKYDNATIKTVVDLVKYHDSDISSRKALKRMMNRIGEKQTSLLIALKEADIYAQNPDYQDDRLRSIWNSLSMYGDILVKEECFAIKLLAINGHDLIAKGMKPGPEIGKFLNECLSIVMDDPDKNNKEYLLSLLEGNSNE